MNDYKLGMKVFNLLVDHKLGTSGYLIPPDQEYHVAKLLGMKVSDHWPRIGKGDSIFKHLEQKRALSHDRDKRAFLMLGSRARGRTLRTDHLTPDNLIKLTALVAGVPTPTESRAIRRSNWIGQIETGMVITAWLESLPSQTPRFPVWHFTEDFFKGKRHGFIYYMGNPEKFDGRSYIQGNGIQYINWKSCINDSAPCCDPRMMARIGRWFSSGRLNVLIDELGSPTEWSLKFSAFYAEYKCNGKRFDAGILPNGTVLRAAAGTENQPYSRSDPKCST